ncbi:MAG: hypothetical protein JO072_09075 [Parafilimonas sp.]|nr:hypothetical protein [Parafilimonas sp.]
MKQLFFLYLVLFLCSNCFSQKVKLLNGETAIVVTVKNDGGKTTDSKTIQLLLELTGTSANAVNLDLKTAPEKLPDCITSIDPSITINATDWPTAGQDSKVITKDVVIKTKSVDNVPGDVSLTIMLNNATTAHNYNLIVGDNKMLVHFNVATILNYSFKTDLSNTLKTDFSFYTDFLGVDNERPNGLYQLELGFKIPVNKYKSKVYTKSDPSGSSYFQWFRSFYFTMNMMNLDNLLKEDLTNTGAKPITKTDSSTQIGIDTIIKPNAGGTGNDTSFTPSYAQRKLINSFDLYQWASFVSVLKLNILSWRFPRHHFYVGYNIALLRTPIYDSLANTRVHVTSFMHGPDAYYETDFKIGNPVFNVRINADYYWLKLWNNDLEQIDAPVFKYNTKSPQINYYTDTKVARIFQGSFRIAYIYNKQENSDGNQIFLRVSSSIQTPDVNTVKFHNSFTQVQFGGLFDISKILSKAPSQPGDENK